MIWPARCARIFLLWAFCCGLAGHLAASARADGPALTAVFGIAGRYRPGTWCPVTVTIKNPTSDSIAGQIQVLADSDSNHGGYGAGGNRELGAALFARPVTVSAVPGPQTFQLDTRGLDPGRDNITVQLAEGRERGDGRVLAQIKAQDADTSRAVSGVPVSDTDPLLVGFGGDPGAFTYLSGQKLGLLHQPGGGLSRWNSQSQNGQGVPSSAPPSVQVAEASGGDLPDKAAGYGGVNAFLLRSDAPLDALTEAQADALKGWVAGGGRLIVCGGVDPSRFGASFFSGLLPASVGTVHPAVTLPGAGQVEALTLTPKPLPGVRVLASAGDGTPLIVTGPYGTGSVTLTAYDPTAKAFQSPAFNASALWQTLLTGGPATSAALLPCVAAHEENYQANVFYGGGSQLLADAVMRGPSLDAPGTEVIGLFLLVYLIALVPANYLVLKRLDRKELAWVTIPLLVLFFAVGTFGVGYAAKGGSVFINRASIVETSAGRREAAVYAELGLFSPHRTSYDLTLPGPNVLTAIPNRGFNSGYRGGAGSDPQSYGLVKFVQTPEGASVLDASVNMWAMRAFDIQATADLGGTVDSALAEAGGTVTGTIANHTGNNLRDCVVVYHGATASLGDLRSGASLPLSMIAAPLSGRPMPALSLPQIHNYENSSEAGGDIHARIQSALADFVRSLGSQNNNYYGNQMQAPAVYTPSPGEALLLGWSDAPVLAGPAPHVDGHAVKENDVTLIVIHLPVKGARIMAALPMPPPLFPLNGRPRALFVSRPMAFSPTAEFGTISRNSLACRQALNTRSPGLTSPPSGKMVYFRGVVRVISQDPFGPVLILGPASGQPVNSRALGAPVRSLNPRLFPNPYRLQGREILISGLVYGRQDLPQIVLTQSSQIKIVQ